MRMRRGLTDRARRPYLKQDAAASLGPASARGVPSLSPTSSAVHRRSRRMAEVGATRNPHYDYGVGMTIVAWRRVCRLSSASVTACGVVYVAGIAAIALRGESLAAPHPSENTRWWAALGTLAMCPPLVCIFFSLRALCVSSARRALDLSRTCALLFGLTIGGSRTAFLVVGRGGRFAHDILSAEIFGWGVLLSLAILSATPAFSANARLGATIRRAGFAYAVVGLHSALSLAVGSQWYLLGFAAWGLILYVWTALVAVWCHGAAASTELAKSR